MVEIFFGIIIRQAIRRGTFSSVKELTTAIGVFINAYNNRCQPFAWTKGADELPSPAATPSSAWSAQSWLSSTTNGPRCAATSAWTSWPAAG
jgi:hypothetical protein